MTDIIVCLVNQRWRLAPTVLEGLWQYHDLYQVHKGRMGTGTHYAGFQCQNPDDPVLIPMILSSVSHTGWHRAGHPEKNLNTPEEVWPPHRLECPACQTGQSTANVRRCILCLVNSTESYRIWSCYITMLINVTDALPISQPKLSRHWKKFGAPTPTRDAGHVPMWWLLLVQLAPSGESN